MDLNAIRISMRKCLSIGFMVALASCGGGGGSGSSGGSGGGSQSYGTVTVGTVAPLSVKSAFSGYIIPVYNDSESPVVLGNIVSSNDSNVTFDLGSCAGKTLNAGDECSINASYNGASSVSGIQHAIGSLSVDKSGTDGSPSSIKFVLDYETLPSDYSNVFLAQSLAPILLRGNSVYTTLWLFNGSNVSIPFNKSSQFDALPNLGSGIWTDVATNCGLSVNPGSGCHVLYKYSTNLQTINNFLRQSKIKIVPPIASAKIVANLTGYNVYSDLSVQTAQSASSQINLNTINMTGESFQLLIVNSGNLPIDGLDAKIIGNGFSVDSSNCQSELPLAPGSDVCYLTIKKNNPKGVASLKINYFDEVESHFVSAPINYGDLTLTPNAWIINVPQDESASTIITLSNGGGLPLQYSGNSPKGLQDFTVDDSKCLNQQLGSCVITLNYSPKSANESGNGTIVFTAGSQNVTLPVTYSSSPGEDVDLEFCSDSLCNTPIVKSDIASQVAKSSTHVIYVKNVGKKTASGIDLNMSPSVPDLVLSSNTCTGSLASGSICQFMLNYSPSKVESGQTSLAANYTGGPSILEVNYSSTESTYANVVYCDDSSCTNHVTSINFNAAIHGTQSQTFYVSNNGTESAFGASYKFLDTFADISIESNNCGEKLLNDGSVCSIKIGFSPQKAESGTVKFAIKYSDSTGNRESDLNLNYYSTDTPATNGILYYHAKFDNDLSGNAIITSFVDEPLILTVRYNPIIISSYIGGVLVGYLLDKDPVYTPVLEGHYDDDYIIGAVFSQLMQEDGPQVVADFPAERDSIVDPKRDVMGAGQGGPWQINGYLYKQIGADQSTGLINYIALQKMLGYSVDTTKLDKTPQVFNNLHRGPILVAYELEQYFVGQLISTSGAGSVPPVTQQCMENLGGQNPATSPFDVIMKTLYNAGQTSDYSTSIESDCTNLNTDEFSAKYNTYNAATRLNNDSYAWYPFQTRFYTDELSNNVPSSLVPGAAVAPSAKNNNHVYFTLSDAKSIFAAAFESIGYMTDPHDSSTFKYVTYNVALDAFNNSETQQSLTDGTIIDLGNSTQKHQFYTVVKGAIANIVSQTGADLFGIISSDIGVCPKSIQCFESYIPAPGYNVGDLVSFKSGGSSNIYQCLQKGWCDQSAYDPRESGVAYGAWKDYILDKQCTNSCATK